MQTAPDYQTVEELCDEVERQAETIKRQAATIAQLRALLGEDDRAESGLLTED
jgi:hypothetical protein